MEQIEMPFSNYIQVPSCEFAVDYTITLIEKTYMSDEKPKFTKSIEG